MKFVGLINNLIKLGCFTALLASSGVCSLALAQSPAALSRPISSSDQTLMAAFAEADAGLAEDVGLEIAVHQAVLAYQQDRYSEALEQLQSSGSQRMAAKYFQGLALIRLNRVDEASQVLNELRSNPQVPELIDVGIAQALLDSGSSDEAIKLLQEHTTLHPEDVSAAELLRTVNPAAAPEANMSAMEVPYPEGDILASTAPAEEPRNWNLSFLTGYDYDTNVVRAPTFSGLGSGFQHADSSWITALIGDYRVIQEQDLVVGTIGSIFYADRFNLNQYDTLNVVGGMYANRSIGDVIVGVNYQFVDTLMNGSQFSAEHRLVTNVSLLEGTFGHSTAYYEFDANNLKTAALIPAQQQSGTTNAVGLTQAVYLFEGAGRLFGGYRFAKNNADGADFDYDSHMLTARIEAPLNGDGVLSNWIGDAEYRAFFDRYDSPNSLDFMGNKRSDNRGEVRTGLQKFLTEHLSVRFDYTYVTSDSNVANLFGVGFYDYDRHAITSQLIYDF